MGLGYEIKPRHRQLLHALFQGGRLSRWELHQRTGLRPNTVGEDAALLVQAGLIRRCQPARGNAEQPRNTGRPGEPLEIDPSNYNVLGVSIQPNQVAVAQLDLRGQMLGHIDAQPLLDPERIGTMTRDLVIPRLNEKTLSVGITTTGKYNAQRRVLLGSWLPDWREISLEPLYQAIGNRPALLKNDMAALANRWVLQNNPTTDEHVLLLSLEDGNVGGSLLTSDDTQRPLLLKNELGHTRLFVDTDRCYCGHTGCLTELCSSRYLRRLDPAAPPLPQAAQAYDGAQPATRQLIDYVAAAIGNTANTIFVDRIVLVSALAQYQTFAQSIVEQIRTELLFINHGRKITIELWNDPVLRQAETAAWQALVGLYVSGWSEATDKQPMVVSSRQGGDAPAM